MQTWGSSLWPHSRSRNLFEERTQSTGLQLLLVAPAESLDFKARDFERTGRGPEARLISAIGRTRLALLWSSKEDQRSHGFRRAMCPIEETVQVTLYRSPLLADDPTAQRLPLPNWLRRRKRSMQPNLIGVCVAWTSSTVSATAGWLSCGMCRFSVQKPWNKCKQQNQIWWKDVKSWK